jgi:hypothetical protein
MGTRSKGLSNQNQESTFEEKTFRPPVGHHWKTSVEGLQHLAKNERILVGDNTLDDVKVLEDKILLPSLTQIFGITLPLARILKRSMWSKRPAKSSPAASS